MTWWQEILIILSFGVAGGAIGLLLGYVFLRLKGKRSPTFSSISLMSNECNVTKSEPIPDTIDKIVNAGKPASSIPGRTEMNTSVESLAADLLNSRKTNGVTSAELDEILKVYQSEVAANLVIAANPTLDKLVPFQTDVWDNNRSASGELTPAVKVELLEAYTDIVMANTIVWLSTVVGRRSKNLDATYINLCNKIEQRLKDIIPMLDGSGEKK